MGSLKPQAHAPYNFVKASEHELPRMSWCHCLLLLGAGRRGGELSQNVAKASIKASGSWILDGFYERLVFVFRRTYNSSRLKSDEQGALNLQLN